MYINIYLYLAEDETYSSSKESNWLVRTPLGLMDHREVNPGPWAPAESGVLVGELKHVASLF